MLYFENKTLRCFKEFFQA